MFKNTQHLFLAGWFLSSAILVATPVSASVVAISDFTGVVDDPGTNSLNGYDHWTVTTGSTFGTVDIVNEEVTLNADFPPVMYNWTADWGFRDDAGSSAPPVGSIYRIQYTARADELAGGGFPPILYAQVPATAGFPVMNSVTFRMNESGWGIDLDFSGTTDPSSPVIGAGEVGLVEFIINGSASPYNSAGNVVSAFNAGVFLTNTSTDNVRSFVGEAFMGNVTDPGNSLLLATYGDGWAGTFDNFSVELIPEPASWILLLTGLVGFMRVVRSPIPSPLGSRAS